MAIELSPEVTSALGPIVGALAAEGFVPTQVEQSSSFGNFSVLFSCGLISSRLLSFCLGGLLIICQHSGVGGGGNGTPAAIG